MSKETRFGFIAGHVALDFVNTVAWRLTSEPKDKLASYRDLVDWAELAKLLDRRDASTLRQTAEADPKEAKRCFKLAVDLRESIYQICASLLRQRKPSADHLEKLNSLYKKATRSSELTWKGGALRWSRSPEDPQAIVATLSRCAVQLLTNTSARISQCGDEDGCGWLFLDRSRGRARRWCSMAECGNRAKARRHYRNQAARRST